MTCKPSVSETVLRELIRNGYSTRKAAEHLSISQTSVRYWMKIYKIPSIAKNRKTCIRCNNSTARKDTFCSISCFQTQRYEDRIKAWFDGKITGTRSSTGQLSDFVRKWIRDQISAYGKNCCWDCGWKAVNPNTGKVPVEVDHIDGNWKNNRPDNLQLLCPNCHAIKSTSFVGMNNPDQGVNKPDWLLRSRNQSTRYRLQPDLLLKDGQDS